jgi:hypothetical protein
MPKTKNNSRVRREAQRRKDCEAKIKLLLVLLEELKAAAILKLETSSNSDVENVFLTTYCNNCKMLLSFFEKQLEAVSMVEETETDLAIEGPGWYASSLIMHKLKYLSTRECREIADASASYEICISEIDARICDIAYDYANPKGEE